MKYKIMNKIYEIYPSMKKGGKGGTVIRPSYKKEVKGKVNTHDTYM